MMKIRHRLTEVHIEPWVNCRDNGVLRCIRTASRFIPTRCGCGSGLFLATIESPLIGRSVAATRKGVVIWEDNIIEMGRSVLRSEANVEQV